MKKNKLNTIVITGIMSACCFVSFSLLRIQEPIMIHLGNVVCLLASLLVGGLSGGICGSIGMGIGDAFVADGLYKIPKTIVCKMVMALTAGYFGHRFFKINEKQSKMKLFVTLLISLVVNVIFELIFGYLYYKYLLRQPTDSFSIYITIRLSSYLITSLITLVVTYFIYYPIYNRVKSYL